MNLYSRTVSPIFRETIKNLCPQLGENPAYWNFFYILHFGMREKKTGKVLIPRELIALCEGNKFLTNDKNYTAKKFLLAFKYDVNPTLEWSDWSYIDNKCRVVDHIEWSSEILQAVANERNEVWKTSGRVYVSDGEAWNEYRQQRIRELTYEETVRRMEFAEVEIAKKLLAYMNSLPVLTFSLLEKNMPHAKEIAKQQTSRDHQLDLLRQIEDEYKPFYKPTEKSVRIFPFSENICSLQRNVRKALVRGWTDFDLKSAQLAIAAKLWNLPDVMEYLEERNSIWNDLYKTFGLTKEQYPDAKDYFKEALYAVMYGATRGTVAEILSPLGKNAFYTFTSHYIIQITWNASREQLIQISRNGGMKDCFGRWLAVKKETSCRSILAQASQAMELLLLSGVVELAIQEKYTKSFKITLWQHDGFSVQFRRKAQQTYWIKRIMEAVTDRAEELGVPTSLEVTNLSL